MEVEPTRQFRRDTRQLGSAEIRHRLDQVIEQLLAAASVTELAGVERVTAPGEHYRIRIGGYRLGVTMEGGTAVLRRFMRRGEFYRYFP